MAVLPQALLITQLSSSSDRKELACGEAAAAIPITLMTTSAIALHVHLPSQNYFVLIKSKPVFLTHVTLCGHFHCSLFVRSVKENICSWGFHRWCWDLRYFMVIKLKPALFGGVFAVGGVVPSVQPTVMILQMAKGEEKIDGFRKLPFLTWLRKMK